MNTLKTHLEGKFKIAVVKPNGKISYPLGDDYVPNLVLNSGKDLFFTLSSGNTGPLATLMNFCRAGTGTNSVVATDTDLQTQVKSSNTYVNGFNGVTDNLITGSRTFKRTYEFTPESGLVNYTEVGVSNAASGNLFSRVLLPAPVAVNTLENLRITYELTVTVPQIITPSTITAENEGFNMAGQMKIVGAFNNIFPTILANGTITSSSFESGTAKSNILNGWGGTHSLGGPTRTMGMILRTSVAFPAVNANIASTGTILAAVSDAANVINTAYQPGSFEKTTAWVFTPANPGAIISTIGTITLTPNNNFSFPSLSESSSNNGLQINLDNNQTKLNTHRLTIGLMWSLS
jgi:hypothetical protein